MLVNQSSMKLKDVTNSHCLHGLLNAIGLCVDKVDYLKSSNCCAMEALFEMPSLPLRYHTILQLDFKLSYKYLSNFEKVCPESQ